ncbi:MAG: hydrolase [Glaciihabitans sp.]|nr:hydrolase [Glaciihabitans sp.]
MSLLFIFDMDNVLYDYDWHVRMAALSEVTGLSVAEMRDRWWLTGRENQAEAGAYRSGDAYLDAFSDAMGVRISRHDWVRIRGGAMTPWPKSIAAVARAAELGQVTLLTNSSVLVEENLHTLAPLLIDIFGEHLLTSSFYGARKPDPEVFENVLSHYGVDAADAFFADDLEVNVAGAVSIGIHGHHFTSSEKLHGAIEHFAELRRKDAGLATAP